MNTEAGSGSLAAFPPRRKHLILVAILVAAVYLGSVTDKWWPTSDSALYVGLGKSLAQGQGYQFNGQPCDLVTPGLPIILAGIRGALGEGFWAPNLFIALCGLGALALIYLVMCRLSHRRMALAVVLCCGFSYSFYVGSHRILTGMPFVLLFWATLYAYMRAIRGNLLWAPAAIVFTATALAIRAPGAIILGPMAVGMFFDRPATGQRRRLQLLSAALLLTVIATMGLFYLLGRGLSQNTPLYAARVGEVGTSSVLQRRAGQLGEMGFRILETTAEMFTSQAGLRVLAPALLAFMIIGLCIQWKRGLRMPAVTVVLYLLGMCLVGGPSMVRPRYALPVQPLVIYMALEGLLWVLEYVRRLRGKMSSPAAQLKAMTIFVAAVIVLNAPRLARSAVIYTYHSHTPRYYQVIRHGKFDEMFRVAKHLDQSTPADAVVAISEDGSKILHFLSGRRVVALPDSARATAADAQRVVEFIRSVPEATFVAIDMKSDQPEYRLSLQETLAAWPEMKDSYVGNRWRVYRRG